MNEIHIILKDELDGSLTMRFESGKGKNINLLIDTKAKRVCKFIVGVLDSVPKKIMQDMLEGAIVNMDIDFTIKPRGGMKH